MKQFITCVVLFLASAVANPTSAGIETMESAANHLSRFGYVPHDSLQSMVGSLHEGNMEPLLAAVRRYQQTFSLPVTGELDAATLEMMNMPRCGLADDGMMAPEGTPTRSRRYSIHDSNWPKTDLTYFIEQWTTDLPRAEVEREIRRAFDTWSAVSPLRFSRVNSRAADIVIKFGGRSHGDPYPFDGPGGTLAHAFYPSSGGDAHFDEDETWTIRTYQGKNLYQVAVHEFGHSLGIRHSDVRGSIMFPAYTGYRPGAGLHQDDINAIRAIYGAGAATTSSTSRAPSSTTRRTSPTTRRTSSTTRRTSSTTRRTSSTTRLQTGALPACSVTNWDSVLTTLSGKTYFFKDAYYYEQGDPTARLISADWAGVRGRVDAALTLSSGYSLIIQGEYFWVFRDQNRYDYAERKIGNYFGMLAREVDASWTWARDKTFYLIKDGQVWRNNDATYPRTFAAEFGGAPQSVDAATSDGRGKTYFFRGAHYYTLDDSSRRVSGAARSTATDWFGCGGSHGALQQGAEARREDEQMLQEKLEFEHMLSDKDQQFAATAGSARVSATLASFLALIITVALF